jgi:phenylacetate-CoA ligase
VIRPRREVDTLRLRVGYATAGARDLGQVRTQVTDAVHEAVGVRPDIELVEHDVLLRQGPPHKIPRVASA